MENQAPKNDLRQIDFLFFLFVVMAMLLGAMIGTAIAAALGLATGVQMEQVIGEIGEDSPLGIRNFLRVANGVSHLFTFTLPAIAIGLYYYGKDLWSSLELQRSPLSRTAGLSVLFILCSYPFAQTLYWINRQIPLPELLTGMEASAEQLLTALLVMNSPAELFLNLLIVAVLPALGEELIFRGLVQNRLKKMIGRAVPAIWIAAVIFSAIHLQFEGFLPRLLLGAALGYLYVWSCNLWIPILAHFVFNASQVLAQYFFGEQISALEAAESLDPNWAMGIVSLAAMIFIGYLLKPAKTTPEA